jgi:prevent-host-death family protein
MYKYMYNIEMQRSYSVADARSKLAEIIDEVESGEDIEIVRRGKKVAVLVSPARYARMAGEKTAFGDAYDAFMRNRDPKVFGLDAEEFEKSRDRAPGRTVKL